METFYHGTSVLFKKFDLARALQGAGKVKFGYGVYVTSHYRSAAHYAIPAAPHHYVYTVEVPEIKDDNYIAFKEPVNPVIVKRAEEKLGEAIPKKMTLDGKYFRKFLANKLNGKKLSDKVDLEGEKKASAFLLSIGVDFIQWPYIWKKPEIGSNRAILDDSKVKIISVDEVQLDKKEQLIEGSQIPINLNDINQLI